MLLCRGFESQNAVIFKLDIRPAFLCETAQHQNYVGRILKGKIKF